MNELTEASTIAQELGAAYARHVAFYRDQMNMTPADADAKAREPWKGTETLPADQIGWFHLSRLAETRPEAAHALWERITAEARAELDTGHRAARVMNTFNDGPWQRAQFLAIRAAFIDEWQPVGGIEQAMIDMLAQAYATYLSWMEMLTTYTNIQAHRDKRDSQQRGWTPPRLNDVETMEQAAAMADRFNRLFLRTLRQMRDLRRYAPAVTIQNAGQVNIAHQQLNAAHVQGNASTKSAGIPQDEAVSPCTPGGASERA